MAHTHELVFAASTLTKRYRSWHRGEPRREWSALQHIQRHAPGLAPEPVTADLDSVPPSVTMRIIPGEPLAGELTPAQLRGLTTAITTLWAVPHHSLTGIEPWRDDLRFARELTDGTRPAGDGAAAAYDAAVAWWNGPDPALLRTTSSATVLGHRDPNLANYLWDGRQVRIVDFEDAAVSDPATELAILVEHLSTRRLDAAAFCAQFDVDPRRLLAARRLWAMFWLGLLLPGGPSAPRNPPGTADGQAQRLLNLLDAAG